MGGEGVGCHDGLIPANQYAWKCLENNANAWNTIITAVFVNLEDFPHSFSIAKSTSKFFATFKKTAVD